MFVDYSCDIQIILEYCIIIKIVQTHEKSHGSPNS